MVDGSEVLFVELAETDVVRSAPKLQQLVFCGPNFATLTASFEGRPQGVCQQAAASVPVQHGIEVCVPHARPLVIAFGVDDMSSVLEADSPA
jgi:hypothetical protein